MNLIRKDFDVPALRDEFFSPFQDLWNNFYDDFFNRTNLSALKKSGFPKMNVGVEDNKFFVKAAVSGFTPENIKVEVTPNNTVRISGQMSEKYQTSENAKCWIKELTQRQFVKEIPLPEDIQNPQEPQANLSDGILMITWEIKTKEIPKNKTVTINVK